VAFPQTPLPIRVYIAPGAQPADSIDTWEAQGLWTEITDDVRVAEGIQVTSGRSDEASTVDTSNCTLRLDNRSGDYSPRNPSGQWYGALRKNTPLRIELDRAEDTFNRTSSGTWGTSDAGYAWTSVDNGVFTYSVSPSTGGVMGISAANNVSFNLMSGAGGWDSDVRTCISLPAVPAGGAWIATAQVRRSGATATMGVSLAFQTDGSVDLTIERWIGAGSRFILKTVLDVVGTYTANRKVWIRARTLGTVTYGKAWYDGTTEPAAWSTSFNETSPDLTYDSEKAPGTLGSNIGVAGWRVTGNTNVTQMNFWSYSSTATIFVGSVVEWPVRWDQSANDATVPLTAAGVLRRLSQGQSPLQSPLYKTFTQERPILYAYWPLEDDSGALTGAGIGTGVKPASVYSASFGYDGLALGGASSTMTITQDTTISGLIPRTTIANFASGWSVDFMILMEALPPSGQDATVFQVRTSGLKASIGVVVQNGGNVGFHCVDSDGTVGGFATLNAGSFAAGAWYDIRLEVYQPSGAGTDISIRITSLNITTGVVNQAIFAGQGVGSLGIPLSWAFYGSSTSFPAGSVGQVAFFNFGAVFTQTEVLAAARGYAGETATARITRLCGEQNVPLTLLGPSTTIMGPQKNATFLDLLRECETADLGVLYETKYALGLGYRPRSARYSVRNVLNLNVASGWLADAPEPTDDDQNVRNDWTVSRPQGSAVQVIDQAHIDAQGRYDDSVEINVSTDAVLADQAAFRVYLGTIDELRWPQVNVDLARNSVLIATWMSLLVGTRFNITNFPTAQLPGITIDLIIEGWSQTITPYGWDVELNCSPATAWVQTDNIVTTGSTGSTDARIDSDSSFVNAAITSTATSMVVGRAAGDPLWDSTAVPLDINVSGERITVTAISGTGTTQTFTITRSVNAIVKAHSAGEDVVLWLPSYIAL
jgi:hypothetical protein